MAPTNKKIQGRQTNNSLSSMTEHIVISPQNTVNTLEPPRKKKSVTNDKKINEIFAETDEVLQIGMHKVLEHIKNHDDAWPFMDPVEEDIAPRYYSIIRRPMDLQKMEEKLDNAEYNSYTEFKNDFKLIVNNCRLYNGQNNEYTDMVNNLQIAFEKATRKYFDHNSSDEETFFDFLDVKNDAFHEKVLSEKIKNKKLLQLDIEPKSDFFQIKNKQLSNDENNPVREKKRLDNAKIKFDQIKVFESVSPKKEAKITSYKQHKADKRNNDDPKFDFDNIESSLKRKDKKKISKAIKKKHKIKEKIKSKIRKERGRPKGSHKKVDKVKCIENVDENVIINEVELQLEQKEPSERKYKKFMHKLVKKDKEKKSKKIKKHSNDELLEVSLSLVGNEQSLISDYNKKNKHSNNKKITEQTDGRPKEQKIKKKSKKKNREVISEKRKPGRPKLKHDHQDSDNNEVIDYKKKKKGTFKNYVNENIKITNANRIDSPDRELNEKDLDIEDGSPEQAFIPDIIDKYDLIKQRRRQKQNVEPVYINSIPINKSAIKNSESEDEITIISVEDKKKYKSEALLKNLTHKETKNQRLQDTIEKLKKKSKKNKKENTLLDEIFKIKTGKPIEDEKSIYKKIRETYGITKNNDSQTNVSEREQKNVCEYDFIDDFVAPISQKENSKQSKLGADDKCLSNKKKEHILAGKSKFNPKLSKSHTLSGIKKQEKNNLDALELETEQTLKDINKWLELTPHMSEFGSANSSPSRYIIDDLDTVPSRTDEFIRTVPILQENQENDQHLNSQFDALKNETKIGLYDQTTSNKHIKNSLIINEQKPSKISVKDVKTRKSTKLLNYVPTRKRDLHRNIDRLQPGKSKGNLLIAVSNAKRNETDTKSDIIASKVKEVKNSLIVETNESGPKLSLGTVLDSEGFGIIQQHNFQDEKYLKEDNSEKQNFASFNEQNDKTHWGDVKTKSDSLNKQYCKPIIDEFEEVSDKKNDEPKPNLSAWFKAFGIPKKQSNVTLSAPKDGPCGEPTLSVTNNFIQPAMRQRKSSTGSTTSELSSVSQDPDSPRITIDESYTTSYKSPLQLPIVSSGNSPKPSSFSPRQQAISNYEINGPIKVGFYQDTTKCSPDKSPRENANTTQQHSTPNRPLSNPTSSQPNFSYYTKTDCTQTQSTTTSFIETCQKPSEHPTQSTSDYNSNNPSSPYQSEPMSPYLQSPNSPYTNQSSQTAVQQYPAPIIESQKIPFSLTAIAKNTNDLNSEKSMTNNEKEDTPPPIYSSTTQFLSQFKQSNEIQARTESDIVNMNTLNNYNTPSTIEVSNIKVGSNDQNTWTHQGLYGSTQDKSSFPLSLSNTNVNNHNQSQANANVAQNNSENLCNNQPYGLFDFDIRQKKSIECMNSTNDPVALISKNQDALRKQQPLSSTSSFDCKSIDYTNISSDRFKRNETFVTHDNKNLSSCLTLGNQNRPQSKSNVPHSNIHQQQSMYGNNRTNFMESGAVDLKSSTIPQTSISKSLEGTSHFNSYGNNYGGHVQQPQNPSSDYAITASSQQSVRYTDLSRQTPTSHQHQQMDAYKNSAYIRNFASMMAEMGIPSTTQNPYSPSMAHQFVKSFHQATTAALQQFLPGASMTTTAYSKNSRDGETRSALSKSFPSVSQQSASSTVISQYIGSNSTNHASLTSQQQQHMATYQQKFSEAANISQTPCLPQGNTIDMKQSANKKSVKSSSKKNKQASQITSSISHTDNMLNPGINHGVSTYQAQTSAHNFSSYVSNVAGKSTDNISNSVAKVGSSAGSGSSGSAFNFTTTNSLTLPGPPPMVYGEPPSYLEDFRGTTNPYYPIPSSTNHRNSSDTSEKNPATSSTVSTPYHQFLPHPSSRSGYPFMNPSFDPLQQQWNLREDQLRAQMMLASNPYSQSGFPRHLWG